MSNELKPYHSPPFPIQQVHQDTIKIDSAITRNRNVETHPEIQMSVLSFKIPKANSPGLPGAQYDSLPTFAGEQTSSLKALSASTFYCIETFKGSQYANCFRSQSYD